MTQPQITYVRFVSKQPAPRTPSRTYANRKELDLEDCPKGFRAGEHGISYRHERYGTILVPWTGVEHMRVADPAPKKKAAPKKKTAAKKAAETEEQAAE